MASRPCLIVIQSRLASSRLPAKALLPIGGQPSVVLCALRAANTGLPVVVATSDSWQDDAIADAVTRAGIACVRGPHDDVLRRFIETTRGLSAQVAIVRLTADNVFPDGNFVQALLDDFDKRGLDYLGTSSPQDGLPYGLSAEVFTVAALRSAQQSADSAFDREHVTPWLRRQPSAAAYVHPQARAHWARLRCTLDSYEDYTRLLQVFAAVHDPVHARWESLVEQLAANSLLGDAPRIPYRVGPQSTVQGSLTLGTAQLGMPYGVANRTGMPTEEQTDKLLATAADAGITALDTARAYGQAEARIGQRLSGGLRDRLEVVTKLDVIDRTLGADAGASSVRAAVDASVFASAHALRCHRIDTLLLHRWAHRHGWGGAVWTRLAQLKRDGVIRRLGASVSDPSQAIAALADPDIKHLQCPVNVLDQRWRSDAFLAAVRSRPDVVVHARSVLLQGMLALPADQWARATGTDAREPCGTLDEWTRTLGRLNRVDLCLAYVRGLPWVTSLVVGMETTEQLLVNLSYFRRPALSSAEISRIDASLPALPDAFLDPALWNRSHD